MQMPAPLITKFSLTRISFSGDIQHGSKSKDVVSL